MKEKIFYGLKEITRVLIFVMVFLAVFNLGKIYGKYSDNQTLNEFFFTERTYEYNSFNGAPALLKMQIADYSKVTRYLDLGVLFTILTLGFGYLARPESHFIGKVIEKFKGVELDDEI